MKCDQARLRISAALDGELPAAEGTALDLHLEGCAACTTHLERLNRLRQEVRYESLGEVPDVTERVLSAIRPRPRAAYRFRRLPWRLAPVAASFLAGLLVGVILAGAGVEGPPEVVAADIPRRVIEAQTRLRSLSARLEVVERGWHDQVPTRSYEGWLRYQAPESLSVHLSDVSVYPSPTWVRNDVELVIEDGSWWNSGPLACPGEAQPSCTPELQVRAIVNREPFPEASPIPLDLVVPVDSFALADQPPVLGLRAVAGRPAVGIVTTAAQVDPILEELFAGGNWRRLHPTDRAELWLDREALVPLSLEIFPAPSEERDRWAERHGYRDDPGTALLEVHLSEVTLNQTIGGFAGPPSEAIVRDAGFQDLAWEAVGAPVPSKLPPGMEPHRAGRTAAGTLIEVRTWWDGRAWLKVRAVRAWGEPRLFGDLGTAVRKVEMASGGVAYVAEGGSRVALHGRDLDVEITGSLPEARLLETAGWLGIEGLPAPADWREANAATVTEAKASLPALLSPGRLAGFSPPAVRLSGDAVTLSYVGAGERDFVLSQAPGTVLTPPLDAEVRGVEVRGVAGRFTPARGELEWLQEGLVLSLRSETLSLAELIFIAERLAPA
ncbi:MAG: zf-HC2 domain-containing protein [Acidimicrobiia bacterium]